MIAFFKSKNSEIYAVHATNKLTELEIEKYSWVFSGAEYLDSKNIHEKFIGPRKTMVTPWSTNAVEIVQNMGICGVLRIEMFTSYKNDSVIDKIVSVENSCVSDAGNGSAYCNCSCHRFGGTD